MNKNIYLYLVVLIMFIPIGTAKDIIVHDNIIVNLSAFGGGNVTNNYYTSSVLALTCNPANEASYYNGTGFQCVSISTGDSDPYILLTSEGNLNVNSATSWAGRIAPSPDWNSNKSVPWQNLTGVPTDYPNSSIPSKLDIATYSGNYPNTTLNNYGGSFPNTTLINYLLINTYGVNFPNTSLQNYLLTSAYNGNYPNSTLGNYAGNFPNSSLGNYYLNSNPYNFYNSSTVPAYLLISTYGSNFPNNTLSGYGTNFPNSTVATNSAAWTAKEPAITGTVLTDYFTGTKIFRPLNTSIVPEVTNLYYTDARARAAESAIAPLNISLTGVHGIVRQLPAMSTNGNTCSHTAAATNLMTGFNVNYTTSGNTTGTISATLSWQITTPTTAALTQKYTIVYSTGTAPACNAVATGTQIPRTRIYTFQNPVAAAYKYVYDTNFVLDGLAANTKYYFDVQALDSSTATGWIADSPQLTVSEP